MPVLAGMEAVGGRRGQSVVGAAMLAGRYRLIEPMGRGGSAAVWRAEDTVLGRQVAVKVWRSRDADGDVAAAGLWREAARLIHPNVARVYDIGADGDRLFLVIELVAGWDLAAVLAQYGTLSAAAAARIGTQAARVLAAAHAEGIVHRGVKPGNLLVTPDGTVKLTDFGTAASPDADGAGGPTDRPGDHLADAGSYAAYVSPEQVVGLPATPASDLYALGCVLYELLVGHPPFIDDGDDPEVVLRRHVEDEPQPPGRLRSGIPTELEHAVLRMLAKNPADRPAGADRIAEVLQAIEAVQTICDG
jgi:eukaryotic-like serine/threonine-protein kinase